MSLMKKIDAVLDRLEHEIARLREIEAAAKAAGQITKDGKFAAIGKTVYHPKEEMSGAVRVHACGSPLWAEFMPPPDWDIHYHKTTKYPVSECYSTPEAAEAAKENRNETR